MTLNNIWGMLNLPSIAILEHTETLIGKMQLFQRFIKDISINCSSVRSSLGHTAFLLVSKQFPAEKTVRSWTGKNVRSNRCSPMEQSRRASSHGVQKHDVCPAWANLMCHNVCGGGVWAERVTSKRDKPVSDSKRGSFSPKHRPSCLLLWCLYSCVNQATTSSHSWCFSCSPSKWLRLKCDCWSPFSCGNWL